MVCRAHIRRIWRAAAGDFIIRRADGVYAYQLAVVTDDAQAGVTQVVRGSDLLSSTPRQIWLQRQLGFPEPSYYHVPLLVAPDGRRLSKREKDLDMGALRNRYTPEQLLGDAGACVRAAFSQRKRPRRRACGGIFMADGTKGEHCYHKSVKIHRI